MWSFEPIVAKFSYIDSTVGQSFAVRTAVVVLIALIYIYFSKGSFKTTKVQFSALLFIAVVATVIAELIFLFSLTKIPIVNAIVIGHTQPLYVVLLTIFFLKEEKLKKYDYIGIFFMIIASLLVTTRTVDNLASLKIITFWDFTVVIAAVLWASTAVVMKKFLKEVNVGTIIFYRYVIAFVFILGYLALTTKFLVPNFYQVLIGIVLGLGIIFYYEALKRIKVAYVSSLELLSTFFAAALGYVFFQESLTLMAFAGIGFLVLGVLCLAREHT